MLQQDKASSAVISPGRVRQSVNSLGSGISERKKARDHKSASWLRSVGNRAEVVFSNWVTVKGPG